MDEIQFIFAKKSLGYFERETERHRPGEPAAVKSKDRPTTRKESEKDTTTKSLILAQDER